MTGDEAEIGAQLERWVRAVQRRDLAGVVADHAPEIVMFDVPPPQQGVRGLDAYQETWPPFFAWLDAGAVFELESLQVTAGVDVAVAWALLRCGRPEDFAEHPDTRLRITFGLREDAGRWLVVHEHHSYAATD
jgi:uncharacterized protein (TIGR02246 family)